MLRPVASPRQDEDALAPPESAAIRAATAELHPMCIAVVGRVVRDRRYAELGFDARTADLVERSWNRRDPAIAGRLELALAADGVPRLVGYSTSAPQDPALREPLVARWRELRPRLGGRIHFTHDGLLRATAEAAGLATTSLELADVHWEPSRRHLVDRDGEEIKAVVKAASWLPLLAAPFAAMLPDAATLWLEPAWKLVLENRAILPILWQLFPGHPNLIPVARDPSGDAVIPGWVVGGTGP